jgi:predicted SAM-dependent methyltransferase
MPGFINVDIREDVNPDICTDISDLSQFKDQSVDYILAHDVAEHFPHEKVWAVLVEWIRCLKIGGKIEIQVPSIDRIYADRDKIINRHKGDSSLRFSRLIFGGQDYPSNFHCVCFTYEFFKLMESKLNLKIVKYYPEIGLYNHAVIMEKVK